MGTMDNLKSRTKTPIFLLSEPILASDFRDKLMGACIVKPYDPLYAFSSFKGPVPIELQPEIDPNPVDIENYSSVLNRSSSTKVKATFERIINTFFEKSGDSTEARHAAKAKWWKMVSPHEQMESLIKHPAYEDAVMRLFDRNPKEKYVYFVTNILVLSTLKVERGTGRFTNAGVDVGVPDPHTGTAVAQLGAEHGTSNERSVSAEFRHEMIVGLGLYPIRRQAGKKKGRGAGLRSLFRGRRRGDEGDGDKAAAGDLYAGQPIAERTLHEIKMGNSMAEPKDYAQFMSHKKGSAESSPNASSESVLDFELYFPD
ncbi:hypothetical protein PG985_000484 [Apiospora marii]|uniref:Uncharacterized protein n=1 Tax=Apiospora marii TaxID=335849 RepID=A0ABR1R258_9PEZI